MCLKRPGGHVPQENEEKSASMRVMQPAPGISSILGYKINILY